MVKEQLPDFNPSDYYKTKPVLGLIPRMELGRMAELAQKFGPKFWGLNSEAELLRSPETVASRLIQFKKVLRVDPDMSPESYEWIHGSSDAIKRRGETALNGVIVLQKEKCKGKQTQPRIATTYRKSLDDPGIMRRTFREMLEQGDTVAKTIAALEDQRLHADEQPTTSNLLLGIETYKVAMLAMSETAAKQHIGNIALQHHVHIMD
jgi:hypothetical protein